MLISVNVFICVYTCMSMRRINAQCSNVIARACCITIEQLTLYILYIHARPQLRGAGDGGTPSVQALHWFN